MSTRTTINVSKELWEFLKKQAKGRESLEDTMRRLLGLPAIDHSMLDKGGRK